MPRLDQFFEPLFKHGADRLILNSGERAALAFGSEKRNVTTSPLQVPMLGKLLAEIVPEHLSQQVQSEGEHTFGYDSPSGPVNILVRRAGEDLSLEAAPKLAGAPAATGDRAAAPTPARRSAPGASVATDDAPLDMVMPGPATAAMDLLFREMCQQGCSDLHLATGNPPLFRKDGTMMALSSPEPLSAEQVRKMLYSITPSLRQRQFEECHDSDFSYEIPELARFRCNLFRDRNGMGGVFRAIPTKILSVEDLGLSPQIVNLCHLSKGLVVVTGPTGSGKSTTLAALVDYINRNRSDHIITIEDPIEFVHGNKKCLINQREVGSHTNGFKSALRAALREDPDIVLVGEMRDLETVEIAIETAETGHLVFGTLHTNTAASTVDRIIDQFPSDQQSQIRTMLSSSLKGVIAQTLCKKKGGGRVAALEVLIVNHAISNLIREGKTFQIPSLMQTGKKQGMVVLNDALLTLLESGVVEPQEALAKAVDKIEFAEIMQRKGIRLETPIEVM